MYHLLLQVWMHSDLIDYPGKNNQYNFVFSSKIDYPRSLPMASEQDFDIRNRIKVTKPEELYNVTDKYGHPIDYENADGRELFNHYRHNATNYDAVLNEERRRQGRLSAWQQQQATTGSAEKILEIYRDEHVKVIQDSQHKGNILRGLMQRVGVGTASALSQLLDSWSAKIKEIGRLENSQRTFQTWNDTYRVQRELVKEILKREDVSDSVIKQVNAVYSTRSSNKAIALGADLLDLEKSEILKLVKSAIRYAKQ